MPLEAILGATNQSFLPPLIRRKAKPRDAGTRVLGEVELFCESEGVYQCCSTGTDGGGGIADCIGAERPIHTIRKSLSCNACCGQRDREQPRVSHCPQRLARR